VGYYIKRTDTHYADERTVEMDVEYENGKNNDENADATEDDTLILK
jgi:hypothetical protein